VTPSAVVLPLAIDTIGQHGRVTVRGGPTTLITPGSREDRAGWTEVANAAEDCASNGAARQPANLSSLRLSKRFFDLSDAWARTGRVIGNKS